MHLSHLGSLPCRRNHSMLPRALDIKKGKARALLMLAAALICSLGALEEARARSFYVRSLTASRATQYRRLDLGVTAPRPLIQGLELGGFDLLDRGDGSLSARFAMRYMTDIAAASPAQAQLFAPVRFNDLRVDLLYARWRPAPSLEVSAGRQWAWGALGVHDFDGLQIALTRPLRRHTLRLSGYFGFDTQLQAGLAAPDTFDVQGIPVGQDDALEPRNSVTGGTLQWSAHDVLNASLSYRRRWYTEGNALGEERVGASSALTLSESLTVDGGASYHTLLGVIDRASLRSTYARSSSRVTHFFSIGASQRRPWFDSSSIFNLFGATPYRDAYVTWTRQDNSNALRLDVRTWTRSFQGDDEHDDFATSEQDARATGVAIGLTQPKQIASRRAIWRVFSSAQLGASDYGGAQLLLDTSLSLPLEKLRANVTARALGAYITHEHHRLDDERAFSALVSLDARVLTRGKLRLVVEQRASTNDAQSTNIYGVLEVEAWP